MSGKPDPDPTFFEAHPPLMKDVDNLPPQQSDYGLIGDVMQITGKDMNRITDPKYPWRDYLVRTDPPYREKVRTLLAARDNDVDHYNVTRRRYWEQVSAPYHYGVDTDVTITHHQGYTEHKSHTWSETDTVTQRIAADLGIDLSLGGADAPGDVPVPPVGLMATVTENGGDPGGGGSGGNIDLHFSNEVSRTLHIMDVDEQTYTDEVSTTTTQRFLAGTTYIHWQKIEELVVQRVNKGSSEPDPVSVSSVRASTGFDYTDAFVGPVH
jgi:hypothetical protein